MNIKSKKVGKLPVNSRITIDYTKEKPTVKFGYPRKDVEQLSGGVYSLLTFGALLIVFITLFWLYFNAHTTYVSNYFNTSEVKPCHAYLDYYESNYSNYTWLNGLVISCNNGFNANYTYHSGFISNDFLVNLFIKAGSMQPRLMEDLPITNSLIIIALAISALIFFGYIFWKIDRFLMKHVWMKIGPIRKSVPYVNKKVHDKHFYYCFKDVPSDKLYVELPMFKNIKLDYKATEDFSKYLLKMEIKEHPFSRYVKKGKKRAKNIYLWYARWYFSEVPNSGRLHIYFT